MHCIHLLCMQRYNQTVHLVDLHATILDIARVSAAMHPPGTLAVDGVSLLPVLNLSISLDAAVRPNGGELWIADDVLRIGDYKLITGAGTCDVTERAREYDCKLITGVLVYPCARISQTTDNIRCGTPAHNVGSTHPSVCDEIVHT